MRKNIKQIRKTRVRAKAKGMLVKPRLSIFRSNKYVYAQVIDDEKAKTLVGASEKELSTKEKTNKTAKANKLGLLIAKKAVAKKIKEVVFDRGSYKYHGRVKAVAEGAREGGLKF
jgi:large subunit ribosomal protein L18